MITRNPGQNSRREVDRHEKGVPSPIPANLATMGEPITILDTLRLIILHVSSPILDRLSGIGEPVSTPLIRLDPNRVWVIDRHL